jgi:deoxyribonuclease-4
MHGNIQIGVKIATRNLDFIPEIYANQDLIDFIEIILLPEFIPNDVKIIQNLKIPYVIHIPAGVYDLDFGNSEKQPNNIKFIKKLNQAVPKLNPLCFIVHPESGDIDLSITNLKKLRCAPLALENMPKASHLGGELLGFDPPGLQEFFTRMPTLAFCFDLNHAIKAAISQELDPLLFIQEFLAFKQPLLFHIAGGTLSTAIDEHLSLDDGDYPLPALKTLLSQLPYPVPLTFETPKLPDHTIENDLRNMQFFLNL